ncbi:UNVERIFIED_CONTAM: hypothetical protein GTU68_006667 [Idotea baltica]|nr:hypothetical protein [Idotea baltica]
MSTQNKIETNKADFSIRPANSNDAGLILDFIKKLAEYEKLSHEVSATEEMILTQLFGPNPAAEAIIGEFNGKPVAFAVFFSTFSTFLSQPGMYLEDLFVLPEHRGSGFGKVVLSYLAKLAVDRNYGRLEWCVLNWNEPAIEFYRSLNTEEQNEWTVHRLSDNTLSALAEKF